MKFTRLCFRSRLSSVQNPFALWLIVMALLLSGCKSTSADNPELAQIPADAKNADEMMVVDCLLPGKVRKLGSNATYVTQRRPVKSTASECEIRGGDYVAYDRADYSTALKIWLPMAKLGDAEAQTYVGEIYEKGLGLSPNFGVAAHWYQQAATQGHSRAQINLGHLYEKGLGVTVDKERALNLYRQASGIGSDPLVMFASTLNSQYVPKQQYEEVRSEFVTQQRQSQQLQQRVSQLEGRLKTRSVQLRSSEQELKQTQQALTEMVSGLPVSAAGEEASEQEQQLLAEVEQLRAERGKLQQQLTIWQQQNAHLEQSREQAAMQLEATEKAKLSHENQLGRMEQQLTQAKQQLEQSRQELESTEQLLQQQRQNEAELTPALIALQDELAEKSRALRSEQERVESLTAEQRQLLASLTELRDEQTSITKQNADYEQQLSQLSAALLVREKELAQTNERLNLALSDLTQSDASQTDKEKALLNRITQLESERQTLQGELSANQGQSQQVRDQQRQELQDLSAQLSQAESEKANYQSQLANIERQLSEAKSNTERSEQELADAKFRLEKAKADNQTLTPALLALQDELAEKSRAVIEQQRELDDLQQESALQQQQLSKSLDEAEQRYQQLLSQNQSYQSELSTMGGNLAEREAELESTEQQLLLAKAELELERNERKQVLASQDKQHQLALSAQRAELEQLTDRYQQQLALVTSQKQQIQQLRDEVQDSQQASIISTPLAANQPASESDYPAIEIIEPPIVMTRSQPSVRLHRLMGERQVVGKVMAPAGLMSLSVNGKAQVISENNLFQASIAVRHDPTPVDVVVVDKKGRRASVAFSFVTKSSGNERYASAEVKARPASNLREAMGNYYALIIGNNNYQHFSTLSTPVNDARVAERILQERYNFRTRLLLNADRYSILSALNELRQSLKPEDNLLIYYAGHGKIDDNNGRGYWLPIDAELDNTTNWISNTAITDILDVIKAKHILVVADSCYSGTLTQTPLARVETEIPADVRDEWIKVMTETKARISLTSGGVEPVRDSGGGDHSIFAKAFLDTLNYNQSILEGYSLYSQVLKKMAANPNAGEQVPLYAPIHLAGHESGEFFFNPI